MDIRRLTRSLTLVTLAALLLGNQLLFDGLGGGIGLPRAVEAAHAREINEVKAELDATYKLYIDGVKAGADAAALFEKYKALLEEYAGLKAAEPAAPVVETPKDTSLSGFLKGMIAKVNPFSATKTEMSKLEKVLWAVGKAVLPTLAVLLFASMAALPIGWMALGAIAVGGASGGLVNYFYEKRMNHFRPEGSKKSSAEIFRDVTIAGLVDAVMAPINILTAGWTGTLIRNASQQMLLKYALKSGATYFGGRMVSSALAGGLKRTWHREIFKDHLKVENMEREVERILASHQGPGAPPLSASERQVLASLEAEIARLKANDYGWEELKRDTQQALVGAAISGVGGAYLAKLGAGSPLAAKMSMKLFKDTKHTDIIANWVLSNPTNFLTGAANAQVQKNYMDDGIAQIRKKRDAEPTGSVTRQYYDDLLAERIKQRDAIDPVKTGLNQMTDAFLMQTGVLGFSAAKANLIDLPRERAAAVKAKFYAEDETCKSYAEAKANYESLQAKNVTRYQYLKENGNLKGYTQATREHAAALQAAREEMLRKEALAANAFETAKKGRSDFYRDVLARTETDLKVQRRLDLARYLGDDATLEAYKYKVSQTPGNANLPPAELEAKAREAIRADYRKKADDVGRQIEDVERKLRNYNDLLGKGKEDRGLAGLFTWRKEAAERSNIDLNAVRVAELQGGTIAPSTYKMMLVNHAVYTMRAKGATNAEIAAASERLYADADKVILQTWGDWGGVLRAEAVSKVVARIPYEEDGSVNLGTKILNILTREAPKKAQDELVNQYRKQLDAEIKANVLPVVKESFPFPGEEQRRSMLERIKAFFRD